MFEEENMFKTYFLGPFIHLLTDRVINVRMSLAEALANHYNKNKQSYLFSINEI